MFSPTAKLSSFPYANYDIGPQIARLAPLLDTPTAKLAIDE